MDSPIIGSGVRERLRLSGWIVGLTVGKIVAVDVCAGGGVIVAVLVCVGVNVKVGFGVRVIVPIVDIGVCAVKSGVL